MSINESSSSIDKNILVPLEITAAASAIDAGIKKTNGSETTTFVISNEEMNDVLKIVKVLEDSNILLKWITKAIENETKDQKGGFLGMLLRTLGTSFLGNMLTGNWIVRTDYGNKKGKGLVRAGYGNKNFWFRLIL